MLYVIERKQVNERRVGMIDDMKWNNSTLSIGEKNDKLYLKALYNDMLKYNRKYNKPYDFEQYINIVIKEPDSVEKKDYKELVVDKNIKYPNTYDLFWKKTKAISDEFKANPEKYAIKLDVNGNPIDEK